MSEACLSAPPAAPHACACLHCQHPGDERVAPLALIALLGPARRLLQDVTRCGRPKPEWAQAWERWCQEVRALVPRLQGCIEAASELPCAVCENRGWVLRLRQPVPCGACGRITDEDDAASAHREWLEARAEQAAQRVRTAGGGTGALKPEDLEDMLAFLTLGSP